MNCPGAIWPVGFGWWAKANQRTAEKNIEAKAVRKSIEAIPNCPSRAFFIRAHSVSQRSPNAVQKSTVVMKAGQTLENGVRVIAASIAATPVSTAELNTPSRHRCRLSVAMTHPLLVLPKTCV